MFLYGGHIVMVIILSLCIGIILTSHNANGEDFQLPINRAAEINHPIEFHYPHFVQPIKFSNHGLRCFIKHVYNIPDYGTDFLPNNFFHMVQFLERRTDQTRSYYQSVFRMFGNKLKQSMYVNPYAYSEMLDEVTPLLKNACSLQKAPVFTHLQKEISSTMYDAMLNKFDYLKLDPDGYFKDLSQDIISRINSTHELSADTSVEELRKSLMVFFEMTTNKLIWNPNEYEHAWRNVKLLSSQLTKLYEQDIFNDQDDLNDLFITLLERFCLFLDLSFGEIPLGFYAQLRQDIGAKNLFLLELEQEQFIETKAQRLERAITMAEVKTRAYHQGIIVS